MFIFSSRSNHEKGQGLVEYAIILALVAIVVIGVMRVLGPKIGNTFSEVNTALDGGGGSYGSLGEWCQAVGYPHGLHSGSTFQFDDSEGFGWPGGVSGQYTCP